MIVGRAFMPAACLDQHRRPVGRLPAEYNWGDRSLRSRLGKQLISHNADSEPRTQEAIRLYFFSILLRCGGLARGQSIQRPHGGAQGCQVALDLREIAAG